MNELTQRGIEALRSGDRSAARLLLGAALRQDPNDATAWLWLTGALESEAERIQCLKQVLRIDPENAAAARGLALLLGQRAKGAAPAESAPAETAPAESDVPEAAPEESAPLKAAPAEGQFTEAQVYSERETPAQPEESALPAAPVESYPAAEHQPEPLVWEMAAEETEESAPTEAAPPIAETAEEFAPPVVEEVPLAAAPTEAAEAVEARPRRRKARPVDSDSEQVIFRTRPSIVPALLGFWTFLIGAVVVGFLLRETPVLSMTLGIGLVIFLELIFIFTLFRNMAIRYELTDQTLLLRFRGKRVRLPHSDIYSAECHQSFFQRALGTGDIHLRAAVKGELAELRLRNISECHKRAKQINTYIQPAG